MNRNRCRLYSATLILAGFALNGAAACDASAPGSSDRDRGGPMQPEPVVLSDADIAAILSAINTAELQQAQIALQSAQLPEVIAFARAMAIMHGDAEQRGSALFAQLGISPRQNPVSEALTAEATAFTASFGEASDGSFDRTYILSQIGMHERGLSVIDTQLLPSAQRPEVRAELERARAMIVEHLERARQILRSMGG